MIAALVVVVLALATGVALAAPGAQGQGTRAGQNGQVGQGNGVCTGDGQQAQARDRVRDRVCDPEVCGGTCTPTGSGEQRRLGQTEGGGAGGQAGQGTRAGQNGQVGQGNGVCTGDGQQAQARDRVRDRVCDPEMCGGTCTPTGSGEQRRLGQAEGGGARGRPVRAPAAQQTETVVRPRPLPE